jgi:hypothetical protein
VSGPWYHGGVPGIYRGGLILPPSTTRAPSLADYGAVGVCRRDRVYVTDWLDAARMYACMAPFKRAGWVYEVEPVGALEPDDDFVGDDQDDYTSMCAPEARVLRVVERNVAEFQGLNRAQLARLLSKDGDSFPTGLRLRGRAA